MSIKIKTDSSCNIKNKETELYEFHSIKKEYFDEEINEAKDLMIYANASYKPDLFPDYISSNVITTRKLEARIYIEKEKERIVLAFRGSTSIRNWLRDFNFVPSIWNIKKVPQIKVHRGFKDGFHILNKHLEPIIKKILQENTNYKLLITGHSLGAALSSLAGVYYRENNIICENNLKIITYSEPRVGNLEFAKLARELKVKKVRLYNPKDIIVWIKTFRYCHFGNAIAYEESKDPIFINQYIGTNKEISPMKVRLDKNYHSVIWE